MLDIADYESAIQIQYNGVSAISAATRYADSVIRKAFSGVSVINETFAADSEIRTVFIAKTKIK